MNVMGEMTMATCGLLPKINSLFNNSLYSDVQFVFMNEHGACETIYCHKLILALRSKAFAHLFFGEKSLSSVIKMQASRRQLFSLLFKFLYTDDVQFHTFNEAQDLCELASDYFVEDLVKHCQTYMLHGTLTPSNLFSRYNHALKRDIDVLLKDCRNFVSSNVHLVLKSEEFTKASPEVVEDIVKIDNLPLDTELDIIKAVLNWGLESTNRNETPYNEENLRKCIDPFLKHLRILSLTSSEFGYLVEHYNIFTPYESMMLTKKILVPDHINELPDNFCCLTSQRNAPIIRRKSSAEDQQYDSVKPNSPKSVQSDPPKSVQSDINKITFEVRKKAVNKTNAIIPKVKQNFGSSPNIRNFEFPVPDFSQGLRRDFVFNLLESEKSFRLSFRNDIKCWVSIKMKSGNISLHGFELKVKNKNEIKEELEVSVYLQGFSKQRVEKSYKMELHNNILYVNFSKPMKLHERSKGRLEVCIEDLFLDRCSQIGKKLYEINSGLNFECEISIDSNRKTDNDEHFLFLINKLIYTPF